MQELCVDVLQHDTLVNEGLAEDVQDYKGIPPIPFSIELLFWACSSTPFREVLENRIRKSESWNDKKEVVTELVNRLFPGGTVLVDGQMWEKVTYHNQHSLGLGFLEGEESCYLDYFSDHNNPPLITEPTKEVGIQEEHASSPGLNSPSLVPPTEEMDDVSSYEKPHPTPATE